MPALTTPLPQNDQTRRFLGSGWKFPLQVNSRGGIAMSSREVRIEESIYLILSTAKGERVMLGEFGAGIHELVFAPNNVVTLNLVAQNVREALLRYERRIDVLTVDVEATDEQPNLLLIRINYRIRSNNAVGNLVYPFYINEGA